MYDILEKSVKAILYVIIIPVTVVIGTVSSTIKIISGILKKTVQSILYVITLPVTIVIGTVSSIIKTIIGLGILLMILIILIILGFDVNIPISVTSLSSF
jgi:hypothetical protein